jgi:hypothetical protein
VTNGENDHEENKQLQEAHLPHAAVVEDGLPPVGQTVDQNLIIPASMKEKY